MKNNLSVRLSNNLYLELADEGHSRRRWMTALLGSALLGFSVNAYPEGNPDIGKIEYDTHCAVCHGLNGKGDGAALKSELVKPIPDLSLLAKNNNGVFPEDLVYQVIDGRKEIQTHGSREMPIWGAAFKSQTSVYFDQNAPYNNETMVRSRILALVEYLHTLQVR